MTNLKETSILVPFLARNSTPLATADRKKEELLSIAQENVSDIMSALHRDSNSFGWGMLVNNIPAEDGSIKLLEDVETCSLKLVKQQAVVTWKDHTATPRGTLPTDMTQKDINPADSSEPKDLTMFYYRVRSKMIAKRLENSLTMSSWKTLFSKRKKFTWANTNDTASYDVSMMLQILVSGANPSTRVGVSDLKTLISLARLVHY